MDVVPVIDPPVEEHVPSLLDLPLAKLQIIEERQVMTIDWLERGLIEPKLTQNADGLWVLSLLRQGEHGMFEIPYISSHILLADAELGLVVVLIGYHGVEVEKYGRRGYMVQKGQFYRYYRQEPSGDWRAVPWRLLNDEVRSLVLALVEEQGPGWARKPGKLKTERNPPAKPVTTTSYKVVRLIDGRYFSLYDPTVEYFLGERVKQPAKPKHGGGFYSYPTHEQGTAFLTSCVWAIPYHPEVETPMLALLECEISGRRVDYGHKWASTYLRPLRVLEVVPLLDSLN